MTQRYHNPFAVIDLVAPVEQREWYDLYSITGGGGGVDRSPFPRRVDLWFAGLSVAGNGGLRPVNLTGSDTFKFIEGSIFDRDSWRVQTVMLVAMAVDNDVEVVRDPHRVMAVANGMAAAGVPRLVEMLGGDQDAIWNVSEALELLLKGA